MDLIEPVSCACSNTQEHITNHIECRCDGYYRFREKLKAPYAEERIFPRNNKARINGHEWELCRYCGKIRAFRGYLVDCPTCHVKFPGPRPYFPIDFECEECG